MYVIVIWNNENAGLFISLLTQVIDYQSDMVYVIDMRFKLFHLERLNYLN